MEEDESLHDMWAALLANAASPKNESRVRPQFIGILKTMAPDEAYLLKWLQEHRDGTGTISMTEVNEAYIEKFGGDGRTYAYQEAATNPTQANVCILSLESAMLCEVKNHSWIRLTTWGNSFLAAEGVLNFV